MSARIRPGLKASTRRLVAAMIAAAVVPMTAAGPIRSSLPTASAQEATTSETAPPDADNAGDDEIPASVDPRNYFRTKWGDVNGKPAYIYTPKLVEEGAPIPVAGTGFTNLAGDSGAKLGIKFTNNTIKRKVPLPLDQTGLLNGQQRTYIWAVVKAADDGSFSVELDAPTAENADGLDGDPMTPGTLHTLNVNIGALSGMKPDGSGLIDPSGATTTPAFKVVKPGTLEDELADYSFKPSGVPDAYAEGEPLGLPALAGASAEDSSGNVTVTVPGIPKGTWLHVTPVDATGNMTATKLSGQWVQADENGAATFSTGEAATGEYELIVHCATGEGKYIILGRVPWSHTGPPAAAGPATTGVWYEGPQLTPWWTTAANKPSTGNKPATTRTKSRGNRRPSGGGGGAGAVGAAPAAPRVPSTSGGGRAAAAGARSLPTSVPVSGASRGGGASRSASTGRKARGAGSSAARRAGAGNVRSGPVTGVDELPQDDDPNLVADDAPLFGHSTLNQLFMLAAAVMLLLTGMVASALVVAGRAFAPAGASRGAGSDAGSTAVDGTSD